MRVEYIQKKFHTETLRIIDLASEIMLEYQMQGFTLTVRQIYYQFVGRDLFPDDRTWTLIDGRWVRDPNSTNKNATPNYKWLGDIINSARLAGLIDWRMIVDHTRTLQKRPAWDSPQDIMQAAVDSYHIDRWGDQPYRPEIWIEKDALIGVIRRKCKELDVPYVSCRGYASQSVVWQAAQRMHDYRDHHQIPHIIHLGDHDSSGLDMSRDLRERLELFMGYEGWEPGKDWGFQRIALNMDQINEYGPPPFPGKQGDSRYKEYCKRFGPNSWELDALEPSVMNGLIEDAVLELRDDDLFDEIENTEKAQRPVMQAAVDKMEF